MQSSFWSGSSLSFRIVLILGLVWEAFIVFSGMVPWRNLLHW